jgi:outer membrane protein OmpA-like peptidoglycan-associated protein
VAIRDAGSRLRSARFILLCALFSLTGSGPVLAQPSETQILDALKSRSTRAITPSPEERRRSVEERRFIDSLRSRSARSLTLGERGKITEFTRDKPSIDIEITFEYNSDVVGPKALRPLLALGRALSNAQLKGTVFFVNGHTDAEGSANYNQDLSERRAEAVKRILIDEFTLPADTLIAVGYGKTQLKNKANPFAGENRRVQIVNSEQQATSAR